MCCFMRIFSLLLYLLITPVFLLSWKYYLEFLIFYILLPTQWKIIQWTDIGSMNLLCMTNQPSLPLHMCMIPLNLWFVHDDSTNYPPYSNSVTNSLSLTFENQIFTQPKDSRRSSRQYLVRIYLKNYTYILPNLHQSTSTFVIPHSHHIAFTTLHSDI